MEPGQVMSEITLSVPEFVAWTGAAEDGDAGALCRRVLDTERFLRDSEYSAFGRLLLGARLSDAEPATVDELAYALTVVQRASACLQIYRRGDLDTKGYLFAFEAKVVWIEVREAGMRIESGGVEVVESVFSSLVNDLHVNDVVFVRSEALSGDEIGMAWSRGVARTLRQGVWSDAGEIDVNNVGEAMRAFVFEASEN